MIKAITFDLDNTLVDFKKMKDAAVEAGLAAMMQAGIGITTEEARKAIGEIYNQHGLEYQMVFRDLILSTRGKLDHKILTAGIVAYRKAKMQNITVYPGVQETLQELQKRKISLAVVTDAPILQAWTRLYEVQLADYFQAIVTFDDTGEKKPSPKPFLKALAELRVKPEEAMHVGDWPERDIEGARAIGMKTAHAKYGTTKIAIIKADYELNNIREILGII